MIYDNGLETEVLEFKKSLAELDKGIVTLTAMLNKNGFGKVVFGVDNKGEILGAELGNESKGQRVNEFEGVRGFKGLRV